jgi:hypothetical protein
MLSRQNKKGYVMGLFDSSAEGKKVLNDLIKPKSQSGMGQIFDALKNRLGRKVPEYKNMNQKTTLKERRNDGKEIVLMDGSKWEAKEKRGLNPEHAKYWKEKQEVTATFWDQVNDDYIIANPQMRDKSCWSYKGPEMETPQ